MVDPARRRLLTGGLALAGFAALEAGRAGAAIPALPPVSPGRVVRSYDYTDGLVTVTGLANLAEFKAKLAASYRPTDLHVGLLGDSIGAGYYAYDGIRNGWFGRFIERLKQVGGDGGTFISGNIGEKEDGAHQTQNNENLGVAVRCLMTLTSGSNQAVISSASGTVPNGAVVTNLSTTYLPTGTYISAGGGITSGTVTLSNNASSSITNVVTIFSSFAAPATGGPGYSDNTKPWTTTGNGQYFFPFTNLSIVANGWQHSQFTTASGGGATIGGECRYTNGGGTQAMQVNFPPHRYFEPFYTKIGTGSSNPPAASGGDSVLVTDNLGNTLSVVTQDNSLNGTGQMVTNNLVSWDKGSEAARRYTLTQTRGNGTAGVIEALRLRRDKRGVIGYNMSLSGLKMHDVVTNWTTDTDRQHRVGIGAVSYDAMFLGLGFNDFGTYSQNQFNTDAVALVTSWMASGNFNCPLIIMIYPPGGSDGQYLARTAYYQGMAAAVAAVYPKTVIVDCSGIWGQPSTALSQDYYTTLETCCTHPGETGHTRWYDQSYRAMGLPYLA